jgi:hypothetical protein
MRPALSEDRSGIRALVHTREQWLLNRGAKLPAGPAAVVDFAGLDAEDGPLVWVCHDDSGVLRGVTMLRSEMPDGTWSGAELDEPALLLTDTWTHPAPVTRSDRLGALIAL